MKRKPLYALFFLAILCVLAVIAMLLWNAIIPNTLHLVTINYWQALGLLVLGRILLGKFSFPGFGRHDGDDRSHLLKEKLMNMSDEDKASFKAEWKKRFTDHGEESS